MNLSLLKLLVRYSDDYGCVDLSKVKSLYQGSSSLSSELQNLVSNRSQIHDQASASYASLIVCGSLSASNSPSKLQYCAICLERSSSVPFPLLLFVSITCITFALSVPFGLTVFFDLPCFFTSLSVILLSGFPCPLRPWLAEALSYSPST